MRYTIRHGAIASIQYIETDDGQIFDAIFLSEGKPAEIHPRGIMKNVAASMPVEVLATVNRNFGTMFALPYERRQGLIDNFVPEIVECDAPLSAAPIGA